MYKLTTTVLKQPCAFYMATLHPVSCRLRAVWNHKSARHLRLERAQRSLLLTRNTTLGRRLSRASFSPVK